jgi:hypothetical protein
MRHVVAIVLALAFAIGGDAGLYAYSVRERKQEKSFGWCYLGFATEKQRREEQAQFEHDVLRVSALFVNAVALACLYGTLVRWRRDADKIADDEMTA